MALTQLTPFGTPGRRYPMQEMSGPQTAVAGVAAVEAIGVDGVGINGDRALAGVAVADASVVDPGVVYHLRRAAGVASADGVSVDPVGGLAGSSAAAGVAIADAVVVDPHGTGNVAIAHAIGVDPMPSFSPVFVAPGVAAAEATVAEVTTLIGGSRERFVLYDVPSGDVVREIAPTETSFDLTGMLPVGEWGLALTRRDQYGNESDQADGLITVEISAGGSVTTDLVLPADVGSRALKGGEVEVNWSIAPGITPSVTPGSGGEHQAIPASFELAEASDPSTVLATVPGGRRGVFRVEVGPFAHDLTVRLLVRPKDGAGNPGDWTDVPPVVADAVGGVVPEVIGA